MPIFKMPTPTSLHEAQELVRVAQEVRQRLVEARDRLGPYPELRPAYIEIGGLAAELAAVEDHAREQLATFPQS